jgi:di/tricarboxylate transporter
VALSLVKVLGRTMLGLGYAVALSDLVLGPFIMPVFVAAAVTVKGLATALTPYASGPSAVFYGGGYIPTREFWRLGLIFGVIFLAVFFAIGVPYRGWYLG